MKQSRKLKQLAHGTTLLLIILIGSTEYFEWVQQNP